MKDGIMMTPQERKMLRHMFFPNERNIPLYNLARHIDKRRPKHIRKESWVTFSYTTRANLIREWELKQLRQQQQELFDRLKAEAAKSSDE